MSIGERIKTVRKQSGLNQLEFAEKIGYTTAGAVSKIEKGENNTSEQTIKLICQQFSINPAWLKDGIPPMKKPESIDRHEKLNRIMKGDNEFVKSVFIDLLDLPAEAWEEIEVFAKKYLANKKKTAD